VEGRRGEGPKGMRGEDRLRIEVPGYAERHDYEPVSVFLLLPSSRYRPVSHPIARVNSNAAVILELMLGILIGQVAPVGLRATAPSDYSVNSASYFVLPGGFEFTQIKSELPHFDLRIRMGSFHWA